MTGRPAMKTTRLEAFSDGVIAILITIMVLELRVPHGETLADLAPLIPVLSSYVLSFVYLAIYWNNHHHMLHATQRITGGVLWANMALLFWLSLVPAATHWMGETHFAPLPVALYGGVLLAAAVSYFILQNVIIRAQGHDSVLARAVGDDWKGKASLVLYLVAVALATRVPAAALTIYTVVAVIWLIPDPRIERVLGGD